MKIIHFISGVRSGGVEQFLINYTKILNQNRNITEIIIYQHEPDRVCLEKLEGAGNKCIRIANKRTHPVKNLIDTYRILKSEQPDIVHCHMSLLNFFPLFIAMFVGIKVRICHAHISMDNINSKILSTIFKKVNIVFANQLVACGVDAGKYMYQDRPFKVIKNAVDIKKYTVNLEMAQTVRDQLDIPIDAVVVGHIGRFVEQKNHKRLIKIFNEYWQRHHDSYLVLLGNGGLYKRVQSELASMECGNNVRFLGSQKDVVPYYSIMDIFLLPSLYEGLPVVTVEAQSAGIPVIESDTIDSDTKLLPTTKMLDLGSSDQVWAHAIEVAVSTPRIAEEKIEKIMVKKGFSIAEAANDLASYYKQLV